MCRMSYWEMVSGRLDGFWVLETNLNKSSCLGFTQHGLRVCWCRWNLMANTTHSKIFFWAVKYFDEDRLQSNLTFFGAV
jgi:hypothetical protein